MPHGQKTEHKHRQYHNKFSKDCKNGPHQNILKSVLQLATEWSGWGLCGRGGDQLTYCLSSGAVMKYHKLGGGAYKQQTRVSHSSGDEKSEIRMQQGQTLVTVLLRVRTADF